MIKMSNNKYQMTLLCKASSFAWLRKDGSDGQANKLQNLNGRKRSHLTITKSCLLLSFRPSSDEWRNLFMKPLDSLHSLTKRSLFEPIVGLRNLEIMISLEIRNWKFSNLTPKELIK